MKRKGVNVEDIVEHNPIALNATYGQRALKMVEFLSPKDVVEMQTIRVGSVHDSGYTMLDDFAGVMIAYSFGIGWDYSWDRMMASNNITVYMFDPTIEKPPLNNSFLKFHKLGIAGNEVKKKNLFSLETLLKLDGNYDKFNMILKLDIEGWEWDILKNCTDLNKFSQIVVELHWFKKMIVSDSNYEILLKVFKNLNETHQLIFVHGNNVGHYYIFGGIPFPDVLEATFVRREKTRKFKNHTIQRKVDNRNRLDRAELFLWWIGKENNLEVEADSWF